MGCAEAVVIAPATPADAPLLADLLHLYIQELSQIFPVECGPDGRFQYAPLPRYWSEPDTRFPFLIRAGPRDVGFAFATRGSPASDAPDDLDVAEFFVLPAERRASVGRRAAHLLWDRVPGRWIVRVSLGNRAGLPFWDPVIREHTGGAFTVSTRPGSPHDWRVYAFDA